MPATVVMPALELAQETGKVLRWLKAPGDTVSQGEPIVEIETDKVTVEVEAPAAGVLRDVTARAGDVVPVGQTIARIFAAGEGGGAAVAPAAPVAPVPPASPVARKIAEQHGVDLTRIRTATGRIEKADVLAYVQSQQRPAGHGAPARIAAASPKARRLAAERGVDLAVLHGSGPGGAVLAADVATARGPAGERTAALGVGNVWRIMAERMTAIWTTAPHFYLVREVDVSRLATWRERASTRAGVRITYTDLLVRLAAAALAQHSRANASWQDGTIVQNADINVGLAVAIDDGLVVPVLHRADTLSLAEIAARREDLVARAHTPTASPPPRPAILAVGRIVDRVVAVNGQPAIRPTMVLTLSCDHRALDGARGAQFLGALADLIEEPLALLG